jgi:PPOX class probable F420-dependent enzyme
MPNMTEAEWRAFANEDTRTGKVATVRANGRSHVAPVWFLVDGDHVIFTTYVDSVKGRALKRDPRFSLCVDNDHLPFTFVLFDAEAELTEDPELLLTWSTRLAHRYMGPDKAEEYGKMYAQPGTYLVRGKITKVIAQVL